MLASCCELRWLYHPIMLHRLLVLSSHLLVVACCTPLSPYLVAPPSCPLVVPASCCVLRCLCHPIMLCRLLVLLLHLLVVACRVIPLSSCAALSSSRRAGWLLVVAVAPPYCPVVMLARCCMPQHLCCPIMLRRLLVLSSHLLVVACCTPLSPYLVAPPSCPLVVLASCCVLQHLCCPIMLRHFLVLSLRLLVVACRFIALTSCAALLSSRRAHWLLVVASPLSSYHLRRPLVLSLCRLIVACRVVALSGCAVLSSSHRSGWLLQRQHDGVGNGSAIAMGNGSSGAKDSGMEARLRWAIVAASRGDATTSRSKREGGAVQSQCVAMGNGGETLTQWEWTITSTSFLGSTFGTAYNDNTVRLTSIYYRVPGN
jgi:hypothetical protein